MGDNIQGIPRVLHTKSTAYSKRCILLHPVHTPSMKVSAGPLPVLQTRIVLPLLEPSHASSSSPSSSWPESSPLWNLIIIITRPHPDHQPYPSNLDHHPLAREKNTICILMCWNMPEFCILFKLCCINNYLCKFQALFTLAEGYTPVCTYYRAHSCIG